MPILDDTDECEDTFYDLEYFLEKHDLDKYEERLAFHWPQKSEVLILTALIGTPTHHNKLVAFQTPATPIM